jgi:hypothetical protein
MRTPHFLILLNTLTMKKIYILFMSMFLSLGLIAQAEKTVVQSINLNGYVAVATVLNGDVQVSEWDKDYIRITTNIELENSTEVILERLVSLGRYALESAVVDGEIIIQMPKASKSVNLRGQTLIENYRFEISIPKNISVRTATPASEGI